MDLQELLEMNIEIANLLNAPQVQLEPVMKGLIEKLIKENEAKLEEIKSKLLNIDNVIVPKGTFYCDCVQPSMQKPISETEYECFDCGKEVKQ